MFGDVKRGAYKIIFVLVTFNILVWLSVFLYGMFYYLYIPAVAHFRPVHFQFDTTCSDGKCSFPTANVTLARKGQNQLLTRGQPYIVILDLEMPESETNQKLGMFMIKLDMVARNGEITKSSCRSGVLHFKSDLHRMLRTLFFAPLLLSGTAEEKQLMSVSLFEHYEEDPMRPACFSSVEIQSHSIEIYTATLRIHAEFTGLRYFMYYWPILSAMLGISTNFFFLSMISLFSWLRFLLSRDETVLTIDVTDTPALLELRRVRALERLYKERKFLKQEPEENQVSNEIPVCNSIIENIGNHETSERNLDTSEKKIDEDDMTEESTGLRKRRP